MGGWWCGVRCGGGGGSDGAVTTMCLIISPHACTNKSGGRTPGSQAPGVPATPFSALMAGVSPGRVPVHTALKNQTPRRPTRARRQPCPKVSANCGDSTVFCAATTIPAPVVAGMYTLVQELHLCELHGFLHCLDHVRHLQTHINGHINNLVQERRTALWDLDSLLHVRNVELDCLLHACSRETCTTDRRTPCQ